MTEVGLLDALFKNLKDPIMVLLFLFVIGSWVGGGWMIKTLRDMVKARDADVKELNSCLTDGLGEINKTTTKLVTLIEGMVYGRRGGNGPS